MCLCLALALAGMGLTSPRAYAAGAAPTGLTSSDSGSGIPVLSWTRLDSATSYNIEVNKSPDFASTGALGSASTVNVHWVPAFQLPQNQLVYWRVRGNTPGGATEWGVDTYTRSAQAAPHLTAPAVDAQLQQPNEPVRFAWDPVEGAVSYSLEISQDSSFVDPARTTTYSTGSTSITPNVLQPANTYYWRVTANLGGGINTSASDVHSYRVTPPNLPVSPTYPADGTTTTIKEVVLDWVPVDGAAKYNLQISTDPNFISGTTTVNNILGTRYSPPTTLDNDQYYWRITPVNASGVATDWSAVPTWHFRRDWPDQPSLEYPENNAKVGDPLYFQWTGGTLASDYTLQFSTDATFPSVGTTSCPTVHTTFTPNKGCWPAAGRKYYWRVLATDAPRQVPSEFLNAEVRSFTYLPDLVTLETPIEGASVTIPTLRWKAYSGAKQYLVSVSNSSGKVAASATTTSTSYTPVGKLPADTYHWQVQAITGDGRTTNAVLDSSQPKFTVSDPSSGTADSPEPTLPSSSTPHNPTLTWTPVANATSYKLIYRAVGDIGWTTPSTSYAYPAGEIAGNGLPQGDYEWYVVAYSGGVKLSESSTHSFFTISTPETVGGYRAAIVGNDLFTASSWCDATLPATCKDLRQTPVLHWDAIPDAAWYHLVISRDNQLTNRVLELDVYNTMWMNTSTLPDSTAGTAYYWEVVPCTLAGCGGLAEPTHAFNKLSSPVVLNEVTAAANDVTLSWQDYLAGLATAKTDQTALATPARTEAETYRVQTSTSPQFTSLLDNLVVDQTTFTSFSTTYPEGPIYWRVQALDGSGNALAWSETGSFTKSSPGPNQVSPAAGDVVDGSVTFSWDPQHYAATYNLEVYKNNDDVPSPANRVINAAGLKQVNYTPTTPLPAAASDYRWRIQRVDGAGRVGAWSALKPFHVSGSPASPVAPAAGAEVEPRGTVFTWQPPATGRPAKYRYTATSGTTVVTADTVARAYAPLVKLADGDWSWTVSTLDTAGQVVATSDPRSFTVVGKPTTSVKITGSGKVGTPLAADPVVWDALDRCDDHLPVVRRHERDLGCDESSVHRQGS